MKLARREAITMVKLQFKVTGRRLVRLTYDDTVVEGSQNDLYCEFAFEGEDFADKTKIANFVYGDMVIPQLIGDDGLCAVPPEVIKPPGFTMTLTIGSLITVKPVLVQVTDNGLPDGVYPPVVTLDLYSQMIGAFEDKYGAAKAEADRAEKQAGTACAAAENAAGAVKSAAEALDRADKALDAAEAAAKVFRIVTKEETDEMLDETFD